MHHADTCGVGPIDLDQIVGGCLAYGDEQRRIVDGVAGAPVEIGALGARYWASGK